MRKVYIYTLVDPRDPDKIRYVGKTINPEKRLYSHCNPSSNVDSYYHLNWLKALKKNKVKPVMELIDG